MACGAVNGLRACAYKGAVAFIHLRRPKRRRDASPQSEESLRFALHLPIAKARQSRAGLTTRTTDAIVAANQLKSANQIRIGQVLTISGGQTPGMVCPVAGSTYAFDWGFPRADGARFHEGIDMMAPAGTPILAPTDGKVTYGSSNVSGKFATLKGSNGWQYYSAHLSKTAKGGKVAAGDVIGYVGNTGDAKGGAPHLHLEIRPLDGRPVNPYPVITAACG